LSYIVFYSAVVHGWVETEGQIINAEKKINTCIELVSAERMKEFNGFIRNLRVRTAENVVIKLL